jgi:2-polyprenyl-3-methyl-5-hydroxy-6-metoxy-1,4-benzoquinol methylase
MVDPFDPVPWYEEWFDRDEYELVYQQRDLSEAERVADLIEQLVHPAPDAQILDVGCGRGRHARVLARRGYRMTGLDLSERAIAEARRRTAEEGLDVTYRVQDMRDPMGTAAYDGVINLFTAFGYFEDDADHTLALQHMANALRPGGWLVQDFLNAPQVIQSLNPEDAHATDGVTIKQNRWVEDGRINKQITLHENGDTRTFCESVRLLTLYDFQQLYEQVGLELVHTVGDYDGAPYTPDSPRLIMHAKNVQGSAF